MTSSFSGTASHPVGDDGRGAPLTPDSDWTRISPVFKLGAAASRQFLWFFGLSTLAAFTVAARSGGGLAGGLLVVLFYWLVIPGMLGVGWFYAYLFWVAFGLMRDEKRSLRRTRHDFQESAQRFGQVHYMDISLDGEEFTGLALAGTSLLVVQDGQMRRFLQAEIRTWHWRVDAPTQLMGSIDAVSKLEFKGKEKRTLEKANGFFLLTYDPMRPELQFRTSNEEVCRRWGVILQNGADGRMALD